MGLPRICSASGMLAVSRIDGFAPIMPKRATPLWRRVRFRGSANSLLIQICDNFQCSVSDTEIHYIRARDALYVKYY